MSYAIIGFGAVGKAIARAFARAGIEVSVATTRSPEAIRADAKAIGPEVVARSASDALSADVVVLAVPFWAHRDLAKIASWKGKVVIDATNAYGVSPSELGDEPSSAVVAKALEGARLVKAFNHLPANVLAEDPKAPGGRRVLFLSSDDEGANQVVAALVEKLGYAPVSLGKIAEGGRLVQARGKSWAPLIFKDLFEKEV